MRTNKPACTAPSRVSESTSPLLGLTGPRLRCVTSFQNQEQIDKHSGEQWNAKDFDACPTNRRETFVEEAKVEVGGMQD